MAAAPAAEHRLVTATRATLRPFPRSWLFVPALRAAEWLPKAVASGADAVIVDLEDGTAPVEKERAREQVRALAVSGRRPGLVVRVNAAPLEGARADLHAAAVAGADVVMLPKVESADDVIAAAAFPFMVIPMIETPTAVLHVAEIAAADPAVIGLAFGSFDLVAALGARPGPDGIELLYARSSIVMAAASVGIAAIDAPWLDIADVAGAALEAQRARRLGFVSKLAIHPSHIAPINAAFTPSDTELAEAREIVAAFEKSEQLGSGVIVVEGRMVDRPLVVAARDIIARAELERMRT